MNMQRCEAEAEEQFRIYYRLGRGKGRVRGDVDAIKVITVLEAKQGEEDALVS